METPKLGVASMLCFNFIIQKLVLYTWSGSNAILYDSLASKEKGQGIGPFMNKLGGILKPCGHGRGEGGFAKYGPQQKSKKSYILSTWFMNDPLVM